MRRLLWPILLPALSLGLFLAQLLREHGYALLAAPGPFVGLWLTLAALVVASWWLYARWLSALAPLPRERALALDWLAYLPFTLLLLYFVPAIGEIRNIGTALLAATLAASLLVRALTLLFFRRAEITSWADRPGLWLATILALALLLRVGLIATQRFHADEALYSHWGLLIATGQDIFLRSEVVDKPPLQLYALALFFKIFGPTETAARLPNILASLASIALLYAIAQTLYDRRVALLGALLLALSPFDIQFAPTAFTDPLMVTLSLAAWWATLRRQPLLAGLLLGLAVMTKPFALFFLPLLLAFLLWPLPAVTLGDRARGSHLQPGNSFPGRSLLSLALGVALVLLAVFCWDVVIRTEQVSFLEASAAHYGGLALLPPRALLPRLQEWLVLLQYATGAPLLNLLLLVGLPLLLLHDLLRPGAGWVDGVLVLFVLAFIAAHTFLSFQTWDRYLLGLVPLLALLLARLLLWPLAFAHRRAFAWPRGTYVALLALLLIVALLRPVRVAQRHGFPLGSTQGTFAGAYEGIEEVAHYFRRMAPPNSILFHHALGWHYSFYMFNYPLRFHYYDADETVLQQAREFADVEKYIVFPSWSSPLPLDALLHSRGWRLVELYRVYRSDGAVSFVIHRLQPLEP